jgi:hypothetical protein
MKQYGTRLIQSMDQFVMKKKINKKLIHPVKKLLLTSDEKADY